MGDELESGFMEAKENFCIYNNNYKPETMARETFNKNADLEMTDIKDEKPKT